MNWLAIETSAKHCSVAVECRGQQFSLTEEEGQQHSRAILSMIDALLADAGCLPEQLQAIAWSAGPGSFTGLRIASSVCQALAYACQLPLVPVSSLHVLAQTLLLNQSLVDGGRIAVAVDARMGDVYHALFESRQGELIRLQEDSLLSVGTLLSLYTGESASPCVRIGDGWLACAAAGQQSLLAGEYRDVTPEVRALLQLAREVPGLDWQYDPALCTPVYLRGADGWQKRERLHQSVVD